MINDPHKDAYLDTPAQREQQRQYQRGKAHGLLWGFFITLAACGLLNILIGVMK